MNKVEELIEKFCPEGVEYKMLWEVTAWDKRFNSVDNEKQQKVYSYPYLLANELFDLAIDNGNVRLLSTGEYIGWTTEEMAGDNLCEGEVVTIPWGKSIGAKTPIKYYNGKFVTADNRIATSINTVVLSNKYLYYWMLSQSELIDSFYRGSGIKHPNMKKVLELPIPVPPLPIQEAIVKILDSFSSHTAELQEKLQAELQAELQARKSQYEFYRNELLTFDRDDADTSSLLSDVSTSSLKESEHPNTTNSQDNPRVTTTIGKPRKVKWMRLGDVGTFIRGNGIQKKDFTETGTGCIHYGQIHTRYGTYTDKTISCIDTKYAEKLKKAHKGDLIIATTSEDVAGVCKAVAWLGDKDIAVSGDAFIYRHNQNPKYMAYLFQTNMFYKYKEMYATGAKVIRVSGDNMANFEFPIPSLSEQERIVSILDRFDTLVNDISTGLPAEISARQQQYEYYRDKLLTFKRKG